MKGLLPLALAWVVIAPGCEWFSTRLGEEGGPCANDGTCREGLACFADTCVKDRCQNSCDDDNPCTVDFCDQITGCGHGANPEGQCNDGDPCTDNDVCVDGACSGTPRDCHSLDGICVQGLCNPDSGSCVEAPVVDGIPCDDELFCTVPDTCQSGVCDLNPRDCSDDDACTLDSCDENLDRCDHLVQPIPEAEGPVNDETCRNTLDDDCDGMTDGTDPDCIYLFCARNSDCPVRQSCQALLSPSRDDILQVCAPGGSMQVDNTGASCTNDAQCFSLWCSLYPSFCIGLCLTDQDCTAGDVNTQTPCIGDDDCALGTLCVADTCKREFACETWVFFLGVDGNGQDIYDRLSICIPRKKPCNSDRDCRSGEACKFFQDSTGTSLVFRCEVGGPGSGQLGADCSTGGGDDCWSDICLVEEGGQQRHYCSMPCRIDSDCGDPVLWVCDSVPSKIDDEHTALLSVCVYRRE